MDRKFSFSGIDRCGTNNGGCSHLCLPNPTGYSCACPTGIKLQDDAKTCKNSKDSICTFGT